MTLELISAASPFTGEGTHVLGASLLGRPLLASRPDWPVQCLEAPLLGAGPDALHETWVTGAPTLQGHTEGIHWRRSGDVLFGQIDLDEPTADSATPASGQPALQDLSEQAYARLFRLLDAQGLPHLWRVWNYMADITGQSGELERYRLFNLGRGSAFVQSARGVEGQVPAACAIGLAGGPLSIAFLAGATPVVPVENPRQVSAYHYPADYGPRSPTFSRAALVYPPGQELLFISGTASIVGHRSVHPGDVRAQSQEAMDNIAAVVAEANRHARGGAFTLPALSYRVYIRHAADHAAVQAALAQRIGAAPLVCLQADICRQELLMEVEAMGAQAV